MAQRELRGLAIDAALPCHIEEGLVGHRRYADERLLELGQEVAGGRHEVFVVGARRCHR